MEEYYTCPNCKEDITTLELDNVASISYYSDYIDHDIVCPKCNAILTICGDFDYDYEFYNTWLEFKKMSTNLDKTEV